MTADDLANLGELFNDIENRVRAHFAATRRERIATAVLSGLAAYAADYRNPNAERVTQEAVASAVRWADALMAELDKKEGG